MDLQIISPFPRERYSLAWDWLNEFRNLNIDDGGPQDYAQFETEMERRRHDGERVCLIIHDGQPVGLVGYIRDREKFALLHGICFTKSVHRTGIPRLAVSRIFESLFVSGVEEIAAGFFAHNIRVDRFLKGFGFTDQEILPDFTKQHGHPVTMKRVLLKAEDFRAEPEMIGGVPSLSAER